MVSPSRRNPLAFLAVPMLISLVLYPVWLEELELACLLSTKEALEVRWISRLLEELQAIGSPGLEVVGREFVSLRKHLQFISIFGVGRVRVVMIPREKRISCSSWH